MISKYVMRRFPYFTPQESEDFQNYIYHISALRGSGELALGAILSPGAWAKKPLFHRFQGLTCPVLAIYGNEDWMDYRHAVSAFEKVKQIRTSVIVIGKAGHHLYLDNVPAFNRAVLDSLSGKGLEKRVHDIVEEDILYVTVNEKESP